MADIIEKIGKYFADQEAQVREMYVHAAAQAASSTGPAKRVSSAAPQPPPRGETAPGKPRNPSESAGGVEATASSLVRRLLSLTKQSAVVAKSESVGRGGVEKTAAWWKHEASSTGESTGVRGAVSEDASEEGGSTTSWQDAASTLSLSARSTETSQSSMKSKKGTTTKRKKKKKKPSKGTKDSEELERERTQQRAAEGLARAQERARRIQMERAMQEKQQQLEREANAARLAEEMRKIEEIRRRGKQFAMRLRPQSAPTTPQSRTPQQQSQHNEFGPATARSEPHEPPAETKPATRFLDDLERRMREQMLDEMKLNETIDSVRVREEEEWTRLQAQIKKTLDRNAIKQERVNAMTKQKQDLLNEISENQAEAAALRHERHQLEEKSKRERLFKQREAEREIHARLRREESQRLVSEERAQSDHAADARAKAKLRVQSRAALLKRVLHGCDIRSSTTASPNQDDEGTVQDRAKSKATILIEAVPELAEFEEDGLGSAAELPTLIHPPVSPKKTVRPPILRAGNPVESSFSWQVTALAMTEIHGILREAFDDLFDTT